MRILAFSDIHGNAPALKLLKDRVEGESYDCMLVAGDLTNADLISTQEMVQQTRAIFSLMERFEIPFYYVWGIPNRESSLASIIQAIEKPEEYEVSEGNIVWHGGEEEEAFIFHSKFHKQNRIDFGTYVPKKDWQAVKEMERFLALLTFGNRVKEKEVVKIGEYWLTSSPEKVTNKTVFVNHHHRKIIPEALIQLDGHLHYGQHVLNYLNLGFLYRDDAHNAQSMIGCYWRLKLENSRVTVDFVNLGGKLKEFVCPTHPEQGKFYVPSYWKKCPVCFSSEEALIKK